MKQIILVLIGLILVLNGFSQISFPNSSNNPIWSESHWQETSGTGIINYWYPRFGLIGDTVINDMVYNKLYLLHDSLLTEDRARYFGCLREDTASRVWFRGNYDDKLLYDFSKGVNDTIWYNDPDYYFELEFVVVESVDSVRLYNGEKRKRLNITSYGGKGTWIEGIGSTLGLLEPCELMFGCRRKSSNSVMCNEGSTLMCYFQNDDLMYKNCSGTCFPVITSLENIKNDNDLIEIYPNPTKDFIHIKYEHGLLSKIELFSSIGHLIKSIQLENKSLVDISDLRNGFYIAKVYTESNKILIINIIKN